MEKGSRIQAILRCAAGHYSASTHGTLKQRVLELSGQIDSQVNSTRQSELSIFVYHTAVPEGQPIVPISDTQSLDQREFSYALILEHFCNIALSHHPLCQIFLVTDSDTPTELNHPNVQVIRLALDTASPMFERVVAMNAFVQSEVFTGPVAFLDSDAFVNRKLARIFEKSFDVAVTYRAAPAAMPFNEGVLFAKVEDKRAVRGFFDAYLGTYASLCATTVLQDKFGEEFSNIKRWRGGQLSLNIVATKHGQEKTQRIKVLNCDPFNFWLSPGSTFTIAELKEKYILHLKGPAKGSFDQIKVAQNRIFSSN